MGNKGGGTDTSRNSHYEKSLSEARSGSMSKIQPFLDNQISLLRNLFTKLDKSQNTSVDIDKLDDVYLLRTMPLYPRIKQLVKEQMNRSNVKRISFEMFIQILTVFHIMTQLEEKYKYLFKLFDIDKDFKLNVDDIAKTLSYLIPQHQESTSMYSKEDYQMLARQYIQKNGEGGFIKLQRFRNIVKEDEVRIFMTILFD